MNLIAHDGSPCPYCGSAVAFWPSSAPLYAGGKDYGPVYVCSAFPRCMAWVGCHRGTTKALGRLADETLRRAKRAAHEYFDVLWQERQRRSNIKKGHAVAKAYCWLASQLGIDARDCHIGMMDVEQCERVRKLCGRYVARLVPLTGRVE